MLTPVQLQQNHVNLAVQQDTLDCLGKALAVDWRLPVQTHSSTQELQ